MRPTLIDKIISSISPEAGLRRMRARASLASIARHYDAATTGRRTDGWRRSSGDPNAALYGSLASLREHARDIVRNNTWAVNGLRSIVNNTVLWGIVPDLEDSPRAAELWKAWAETKQCDADGRLDFYGLQALVMRTVALSGECLIRRRRRRPSDGLSVPLQLQVLEPDFLDTGMDSIRGQSGGPVVQGVEFDSSGKRAAYWIYDSHPGSRMLESTQSKRIPASEIIHVYSLDRPGQVRGVTWFAPAIVKLRDFDEYEDATLLRQKISACFTAFVTDIDGSSSPLGEENTDYAAVESLEPGMINQLKPGQDVRFSAPPMVSDDSFSSRSLRAIAAGIGVTYEDLTGDYSKSNFSSARMSRQRHQASVHSWRWNMLIPLFCETAWEWAMDAALTAGEIDVAPIPSWTPPATPMLEPDREGLALTRLVRAGAMTHDEMVRERGQSPTAHWNEYERGLKRLDEKGIWLDSDVRRVSQAGLTQERMSPSGGEKEDGNVEDD